MTLRLTTYPRLPPIIGVVIVSQVLISVQITHNSVKINTNSTVGSFDLAHLAPLDTVHWKGTVYLESLWVHTGARVYDKSIPTII